MEHPWMSWAEGPGSMLYDSMSWSTRLCRGPVHPYVQKYLCKKLNRKSMINFVPKLLYYVMLYLCYIVLCNIIFFSLKKFLSFKMNLYWTNDRYNILRSNGQVPISYSIPVITWRTLRGRGKGGGILRVIAGKLHKVVALSLDSMMRGAPEHIWEMTGGQHLLGSAGSLHSCTAFVGGCGWELSFLTTVEWTCQENPAHFELAPFAH